MTGTVFNIQRFSVEDGPGIRTNVFLKGCPLNCAWCHNPESKRREAELFYTPDKCIGCGACTAVCEQGCHRITEFGHVFDRTDCIRCGKCVKTCYAGALELCGKEMSSDEVLTEVLKDRAFYGSGGGLTLTGGEPFFQPEFALEILKKAKEAGLHTCVETSGQTSGEIIRKAAALTDLFLFDFKCADPELHRQYTGVSNEGIIRNLRLLDTLDAQVVLRLPVIPEVNLTDAHFEAAAQLAKELQGIIEVDLLPYHPLGISKSERLGKESAYGRTEFLEKQELEKYRDLIAEKTGKKVVL